MNFATSGLAPFYVDYRERLKAAFHGEPVGFAFGFEGPVTTAWELRGHGFFTDVFDATEQQMEEFLGLVTDSIVEFNRFRCELDHTPSINPSKGGLCDDIASMIPPDLWGKMVLPFWERYYRGITTGNRHAHVEDLRPAQLPFLEQAGIFRYDPSISPKLNPRVILAASRVPFAWRLGSFHYPALSVQDVADFVFQAVADGASSVFTMVEGEMCNQETVPKVRAFMAAAEEADRMLEGGESRAAVGGLVSPPGRVRFWDNWPR